MAGPFGLNMGDNPARFGKDLTPQEVPGLYYLAKPPVPHQSFEKFALFFSTKSGLARIRAVSPNIKTTIYGEQLVAEFRLIVAALAKKYGKAVIHQGLKSGTIYDSPRDYMTALTKRDRLLSAEWTVENLTTSDGVGAIEVETYGLNAEMGFIMITYDFANFTEYAAEARTKEDSAL